MNNQSLSIRNSVVFNAIDIDAFCKELCQSTFCPPSYREKPVDVKFAILWGQEVGLNPFQSITGVKIINGKPSLYGDIFLAVCKSNPQWEDMLESIDLKTMTAYCDVRRKGHAPIVRSFSIADAKQANLIRANTPWVTYPKRMLQHRARGFALRDAYADSLCGLIDAEEAQDYSSIKDITPVFDFHRALFDLLNQKGQGEIIKLYMEQHEVAKFSDLPLEFVVKEFEDLNNV